MKGSETMIKKTREEAIEHWINNGLSRRQAIKHAEMCSFFWSDNEIKRGELLERLIDFGIKYDKAAEMADKSVMLQVDLNTFDSDRREFRRLLIAVREENKELRERLCRVDETEKTDVRKFQYTEEEAENIKKEEAKLDAFKQPIKDNDITKGCCRSDCPFNSQEYEDNCNETKRYVNECHEFIGWNDI